MQRVGWIVMAILLLAAPLGLTGSGVLARATVGDASAVIQLGYSRLARLAAPSTLDVRIGREAVSGEQVDLWIEQDYLQGVQIQKIVPEPEEVRSAGDQLIYVFAIDEPGQPMTITVDLRHSTFGLKSGRVGLGAGPTLDFNQFVFP